MLKSLSIFLLVGSILSVNTQSKLSVKFFEHQKSFLENSSQDLLSSQIDVLMKKYYKVEEPGATIIVMKNDSIIFRKAYGMADMQMSIPLQPEKVFKIGSTTKQFTAVAIMLLVEQNKISLDDSIIMYLPDSPADWSAITIRHLLTHTSGIDDYIDYDNIRNDLDVAEVISSLRDQKLLFNPGEKWKYSNPNYILLGKIIEITSGKSYAQFLNDNFFEPLDMKSTNLGNNSRITPGLVSGYRKIKNQYINAPYMSMTQPWSAGGLVSSVDDLAKWFHALINEQVISRESLKQCFTPYHLNNGKSAEYGFGWFVNKFKGRYNVSHGGGVFGFVNHTMYLPQEGVFVALLSNRIVPEAVPGTQGG